MRILYVSHLFPNAVEPDRATYNRQLIGAMCSAGHTLQVIAPVLWFPGQALLRKRHCPPIDETIDGIPVTHPRAFYTPGLCIHHHHHLYRWSVKQHFRHVTHAFAPDHIILGFAYPDAVAIAPLCERAGLSYSIRVHGSDVRVRLRQPRFRHRVLQTLINAPAVFCPGGALKNELLDAGLLSERVHAFNNGVDPNIFCPTAPPPSAHRRQVLFVGNLVAVKGLDCLINAWNALINRHAGQSDFDAELVICGAGPLREKLYRMVDEFGLHDSVTVAGPQPHRDIACRMRAAHCLCLPSRSEGMPNVVVEALSVGLPVVGSSAGEIPNLINDGVNGFIVPLQAAPSSASSRTAANETDARGPEPVEDDSFSLRLSLALESALSRNWNTDQIARSVSFSWSTAAELIIDQITTIQLEARVT